MSEKNNASMDSIKDKFDSKFRYVLLSAKRSEQLIGGAKPRVDHKSPKSARVAMQELLQDKIEWGYGPAPEKSEDTEEAS